MKKCLLAVSAVVLLAVPAFAQKVKIDYTIVEQLGGPKTKTPEWAQKNLSMTALEKDYPGKYAFVIRKNGADLAFLESWVNKIQAGGTITRQISQNIIELTAADEQGGTGGTFQQAMESLSQNVSKARLAGVRREQEWWVLKQFKSKERKGEREYSYSALFLVDKALIDKLVASEMEKALTGVDSASKQRVGSVMENLVNRELLTDAADIQ